MYFVLRLYLALYLVSSQFGTWASSELEEPETKYRHRNDLQQPRDKRSSIGWLVLDSSLKVLLQGAKPLYSNGLDNFFLKHGGTSKAAEDFYRMSPANVKQSKFNGDITQISGDVGNRRVIFRQDHSVGTTITITKHPQYTSTVRLRHMYDQVGDKIIIYTE